jgi:hypothetical protein
MSVSRSLVDHVLNQPARFQPPSPLGWKSSHLNIIVPSLALGGAERSVLDVVQGLRQSGGTGAVYVLNHLAVEYEVEDDPAFPVISLAGIDPSDQMRTIAAQVLCSPTPVVVSHLIRTAQLRLLWRFGLQTIPVIQNSAMGWQEPVSNFDTPHVPFILAVSDDVKAQLRAASSSKPVCVIRHEIQRWKTAEDHKWTLRNTDPRWTSYRRRRAAGGHRAFQDQRSRSSRHIQSCQASQSRILYLRTRAVGRWCRHGLGSWHSGGSCR